MDCMRGTERGSATWGCIVAGLTALTMGAGCAGRPSFPEPISTHQENAFTVYAFDVNRDKKPDFWQYQATDGRKRAIAYAEQAGLPLRRIELGECDPSECPHFVIALDGVPFEIVEELYHEGRFRYFTPPARVICCYPAMTDLALTDLFHTGKCIAFESRYFDRETDRMSKGNEVYLSGLNSPWTKRMLYRCSVWWDALAYLKPQAVFDHEMRGMWKAFAGVKEGRACGYSVGTAGLGTRGGRDAIRAYLREIDEFCERLVYERRGRVNITLTADHGHNLVENRRVSFEETLEHCGYRRTESLTDERDVVDVEYGLVTYAALFTDDPAGVAACLLDHSDVEFACYRDGQDAIVRSIEGDGRIQKVADGYRYVCAGADPLRIGAILNELKNEGHISPEGVIDEQALFEATIEHEYPDPLARVWRALFDLVEEPPDVIVNLRDGACHGSRFFEAMIGRASSTHGSLNRVNSTTFVMTTLGELPPALRSSDVLPSLRRFFRPTRNLLDEKTGDGVDGYASTP